MGKPAVTGAGTIDVDEDNRRFTVGGVVVNEGDVITLDGGTGKVYLGDLPLADPDPSAELGTLLGWADEIRTLECAPTPTTAPGRARQRWGGRRHRSLPEPSTCSWATGSRWCAA